MTSDIGRPMFGDHEQSCPYQHVYDEHQLHRETTPWLIQVDRQLPLAWGVV